jgi:hypothetical protein
LSILIAARGCHRRPPTSPGRRWPSQVLGGLLWSLFATRQCAFRIQKATQQMVRSRAALVGPSALGGWISSFSKRTTRLVRPGIGTTNACTCIASSSSPPRPLFPSTSATVLCLRLAGSGKNPLVAGFTCSRDAGNPNLYLHLTISGVVIAK